MEKVTVTVVNEVGLHARPASLLTKLVKDFDCEIDVIKNGIESKRYQPKSILSIMAMGAMKGDKLTFGIKGRAEKEAARAIEDFIRNGCGE